jgi:DNA invertase Pin-like site-specific DNA recombinase
MKLIAYYRVSTKRQGESGLGIDAQKSAVAAHAHASGTTCAIVAEFIEIESGKDADRPQLAAALAFARATNATLVVAKLDRLSRNVAFLSALMESGVPFVACDNPHANKLTLHILAAVAQAEAEAISIRTKAALAEASKRGAKLGGANPACRNLDAAARARGQSKGGEAIRQACEEFRAAILAIVQVDKSPDVIAAELNEKGITTKRGQPWNRRAVKAILKGK